MKEKDDVKALIELVKKLLAYLESEEAKLSKPVKKEVEVSDKEAPKKVKSKTPPLIEPQTESHQEANKPWAENVTTNSADVWWETKVGGAPGKLYWGLTPECENERKKTEDSSDWEKHKQTIDNLPDDKDIYVKAKDHLGNTYETGVFKFRTRKLASPDMEVWAKPALPGDNDGKSWSWGVPGKSFDSFSGKEQVDAKQIKLPAPHAYSKVMVPTLDGEWYHLRNSQLYNAKTGKKHPAAQKWMPWSKTRVSNVNPDIVYGGGYNSGEFGIFRISDSARIQLYKFPYRGGKGVTFMDEGNFSLDDQYVVVLAGNNRDTLYSYHNKEGGGQILGELHTNGIRLDWATFSRTQEYIVVKENYNPAVYHLYDKKFNYLSKIEAGSGGHHECMAVDSQGRDCMVSQDIQKVSAVALDDPSNPWEVPQGRNNGSGHISAPHELNGWCVVSGGHYKHKSHIVAMPFDKPNDPCYFLANHGVDYSNYKTYERNPMVSVTQDGNAVVYHRSDAQSYMIGKK